MKIDIGIKDANRKTVAGILNELLADEYVLYTKSRNFHWNVTGPNFAELHAFFEKQYGELNEIVDEVAERVRQLGGVSAGSLKEFLDATRLKESAGARKSESKMIGELLHDHEAVIRQIRDDAEKTARLGDAGTNDFLVGLMEQHEKMAWMLRAYIE